MKLYISTNDFLLNSNYFNKIKTNVYKYGNKRALLCMGFRSYFAKNLFYILI